MTEIEYIPAKTMITTVKKPNTWFGMHYNMNIYRGCSHGCIYCDSRSDCYGVEEFDRVRAKKDALLLIRDELRRKTKRGVIGTGSMSDPYNPWEAKLELTRHALELCDAFGFGISIATKSTLLARDMDILEQIKEHSPVLCKVTITTTDNALAEKIEPHVPSSDDRFSLVHSLSSKGLFSGILLMPVLPFLEDSEDNIRGIVEKAAEAGAKFIYPAFGMTLRANQKQWYYKKLEELFPNKGLPALYERQFGNEYTCTSKHAKTLWNFFTEECSKRQLYYKMEDIIHAYQNPYKIEQMRLFDL